MVGVAVAVGVWVGVSVIVGVRLGGAYWVGVAGSCSVGGPGVKVGSMVKMLAVRPGRGSPDVTVGISVPVAPEEAGGLQASAKKPAQ